jgi:hypothetical protein
MLQFPDQSLPDQPELPVKRWRWPAAPLIALVVGAGMAAVGQLTISKQPVTVFVSNQTGAALDTYYILSHGYFVLTCGLLLFALGGVGYLVRRLGSGRIQSVFAIGFWLVLLGILGCLGLMFGQRMMIPRRYVDHPDYYGWMQIAFFALSALSLLGLALVALSVAAAICQRLLRKAP